MLSLFTSTFAKQRIQCNCNIAHCDWTHLYAAEHCQTVSIVTSRWSHLSHIVHHSIELCAGVFLSTVVFTQLRYYCMQLNVSHPFQINRSKNHLTQILTKFCTVVRALSTGQKVGAKIKNICQAVFRIYII